MYAFCIPEDLSLDKYLDKMSKDGEPATDVEIKALCEDLGVDIVFH